jgi:rSAM/selenodomain-associated transferase 1
MFPRALVVMAKEPRPGRVKTRLTPPLTPEQSAHLYAAFLEDLARELPRWDGACDRWLAWADADGEAPELHRLFEPEFRLLRQTGATLTDRMEAVFEHLFERGYASVVMRNSDSPHLPTSLLRSAFEALEDGDGVAVLGPDLDGGYYLVGFDQPNPGVFPRAMSTGSVLAQTRAGAEARGLRVVTLPPFLDVDTARDLAALRREFMDRTDTAHWATHRALEDLT